MTVKQLKDRLLEYDDQLYILMVLEGDGRQIEGSLESLNIRTYDGHPVLEFREYE
jgi:hypothetical protein